MTIISPAKSAVVHRQKLIKNLMQIKIGSPSIILNHLNDGNRFAKVICESESTILSKKELELGFFRLKKLGYSTAFKHQKASYYH